MFSQNYFTFSFWVKHLGYLISLSAWFKGKESPGQALLPLHCLTAQVLPGHLLL